MFLHSIENLLHVLRLVSPNLTNKELQQDEERLGAMKQLLVHMHPNNFPNNYDAQNIYEVRTTLLLAPFYSQDA